MGDFKPARIETTSRWPIGFYHWTVTTSQEGINGYGGFDLCMTGVAWTRRGAERAIRRVERKRDNVRTWEV